MLPLFNLSWQLNTNSSTKRSSKLWPHISHRQNHRSAQFLSNANPSAFPCASGMNHDFAHFCSLRGYVKNDFECRCQHKQQEKEREKKIKTVGTLTKKSVLVPCERTPSRLCRYTRVARTASTATLRTCIFCNFSSYSRSLSLSLSLLSYTSSCARLCPRRSPRSFFSYLSRECFVSNALRLSTTETTSFLHSLESVCFLLLSFSSSSSSLSLSFSVVQILYYVVCSSSSSFHYVYIIYLCVCLLMLLLMDCGVFFMQNENLCVFSKIIIFLKKGQVIHNNNTLLPSLSSSSSSSSSSSLVVVAFDLFYREKETQRRGRRGEKVECR